MHNRDASTQDYTSIHPTYPPYKKREIIMQKKKRGEGIAFIESQNNQK